jgi:DNA adenine methylase
MTAYHGGKQKIGKKLASIIHKESIDISEEEGFQIKGYCEPFCGMLGVYQHIPELFDNEGLKLEYKAGDTNTSVILMWKAVQQGWIPPSKVSEKEYNILKNAPDSAKKGYVAHQYSFWGQYFKGYAPKYGHPSDSSPAVKRVTNIAKKVSNVSFSAKPYTEYSKLKNYVIYCDPPYNNREQWYKGCFDSEKFYEWCREMSENNIVFASDYNAPDDFEKIWSKDVKITGLQVKGAYVPRTENLYLV